MGNKDFKKIQEIFGKNFIGPEQLDSIKNNMGILSPFEMTTDIPIIPFDFDVLQKHSTDYILILGIPTAFDNKPLTINKMRSIFGYNPYVKEPCFYDQDWYLKEYFACRNKLEFKWYLIRKKVFEEGRGKNVNEINLVLKHHKLPSAVLACFTFFSYYYLNSNELLWKHDYIWCRDKDHNGDQIYVGRYLDPEGINKNGFNIHRHLEIRTFYSFVDEITDK